MGEKDIEPLLDTNTIPTQSKKKNTQQYKKGTHKKEREKRGSISLKNPVLTESSDTNLTTDKNNLFNYSAATANQHIGFSICVDILTGEN